MTNDIKRLLQQYTEELYKIYGNHLKYVILYGSYARGDFNEDSDIDIMILLDISDIEIKWYRHLLSEVTYNFNMEHNVDIKPIAKDEEHFKKWAPVYPFYSNIFSEGVNLYGAV